MTVHLATSRGFISEETSQSQIFFSFIATLVEVITSPFLTVSVGFSESEENWLYIALRHCYNNNAWRITILAIAIIIAYLNK